MFMLSAGVHVSFLFFFNDTATTEIYTLSLHDALPISGACLERAAVVVSGDTGVMHMATGVGTPVVALFGPDRKSTRLNSSHGYISYAVFCLKKKNERLNQNTLQKRRSLTETVTATCPF